jgi:hypothetical protein
MPHPRRQIEGGHLAGHAEQFQAEERPKCAAGIECPLHPSYSGRRHHSRYLVKILRAGIGPMSPSPSTALLSAQEAKHANQFAEGLCRPSKKERARETRPVEFQPERVST